MKNIVSIILEAQKQLVLKPIDLAHDITHHYRVYEYCFNIVEIEKLTIDRNLLTVAAWYHDLGGRRGEDASLIKTLIGKHTDDQDFIEKVLETIHEHSFGENQSSLESKILFDADKLEYVNTFRLSWFIKAHKDNFISEGKYKQYQKEWHERISDLKEKLHFNYSKEKFTSLFTSAKKIMGN